MRTQQIVGNFYNKYKTKNPIERYFVTMFVDAFKKLLSRVEAQTILDIGCGEGVMSEIAQNKFPGAFVVGTEIDSEFLRQKTSKNLKYLIVNALPKLCFKGDSFDLVIMTEVLEHVDYPEKALEAIWDVTKRFVIISVPHEPIWRLSNILRLKYLKSFGNTPGHVNFFCLSSFKVLLQKHFLVREYLSPFPWLLALCEKSPKSADAEYCLVRGQALEYQRSEAK